MKNTGKQVLKVSENDVKAIVKDYLDIKGIFHFHNLQGMGSYLGVPDRMAFRNEKKKVEALLFKELKSCGMSSPDTLAEYLATQLDKAGYTKMFYALEIKRPGKKATPNQETFLAEVNKSGGIGVVIDSLESLREVFER